MVGADPVGAKELAVRKTLASVERIARLESEVVMGINGFGVEVYLKCAVRFQVNHGVKEGEVRGGNFEGEFYGGVAGIEVVDESKEAHEAMLPDEEYVIYEPFPQKGKEVVCIDVELLESIHVGNCIVGGSSGAHGSTPCLKDMFSTEVEIDAAKDKLK